MSSLTKLNADELLSNNLYSLISQMGINLPSVTESFYKDFEQAKKRIKPFGGFTSLPSWINLSESELRVIIENANLVPEIDRSDYFSLIDQYGAEIISKLPIIVKLINVLDKRNERFAENNLLEVNYAQNFKECIRNNFGQVSGTKQLEDIDIIDDKGNSDLIHKYINAIDNVQAVNLPELNRVIQAIGNDDVFDHHMQIYDLGGQELFDLGREQFDNTPKVDEVSHLFDLLKCYGPNIVDYLSKIDYSKKSKNPLKKLAVLPQAYAKKIKDHFSKRNVNKVIELTNVLREMGVLAYDINLEDYLIEYEQGIKQDQADIIGGLIRNGIESIFSNDPELIDEINSLKNDYRNACHKLNNFEKGKFQPDFVKFLEQLIFKNYEGVIGIDNPIKAIKYYSLIDKSPKAKEIFKQIIAGTYNPSTSFNYSKDFMIELGEDNKQLINLLKECKVNLKNIRSTSAEISEMVNSGTLSPAKAELLLDAMGQINALKNFKSTHYDGGITVRFDSADKVLQAELLYKIKSCFHLTNGSNRRKSQDYLACETIGFAGVYDDKGRVMARFTVGVDPERKRVGFLSRVYSSMNNDFVPYVTDWMKSFAESLGFEVGGKVEVPFGFSDDAGIECDGFVNSFKKPSQILEYDNVPYNINV